MKIVSVFDGMSCGQQAAERVGIKIDTYYASEIKPHAIKVTQHNYPNTIQLGDITKIDGKQFENIDLFIGGSPCQDFSRANKERLGLEGEKSSLFHHWYRLYKEINPKYFLLENVVMDKQSQRFISDLLDVEPIRINSELVSGQMRDRLYWTNIGGTFKDLVGYNHSLLLQPKDKKIKLSDILEYGYCPLEKSRCLLEGDSRPNTTPIKMFHRFYSTGFTTLIFKDKQHFIDCKKHYDKNFNLMSAEQITELMNDIDISVYDGVRYLNQTELERLQTVKEGYTSILSRNDAACLLGDGWTVDVIAHMFKELV